MQMITLDHSARFLIVSMRDVLMSRRKSLNLAQAGNVSLLTLVARCPGSHPPPRPPVPAQLPFEWREHSTTSTPSMPANDSNAAEPNQPRSVLGP